MNPYFTGSTTSGVRGRMFANLLVLSLFALCSCGRSQGPEGKAKDNDTGSKRTDAAHGNIEMKRYFPLSVGNTWKYRKTVKRNVDVSHFALQTTTESSYDMEEGKTAFTVGRVTEALPEVSYESYSISRKVGDGIFHVDITGSTPRDGRYSGSSVKADPNVTWSYTGPGVLEEIAGEYMMTDATDSHWIACLKTGIYLSPPVSDPDRHLYEIGSVAYKNPVAVPAGTYKNCLRTVTLVHGKNFEAVLAENAPPYYGSTQRPSDIRQGGEFGYFMIESFYALDVGLVKEVQYDILGNVTYVMELTEFKGS